MSKRLALTNEGSLQEFDENSIKNYIDFQKENENKENFLKRVTLSQRYSCYICKDEDIYNIKQLLNNMIPNSLIEEAERDSNGESWIIAYGYDDKPYRNKGGWGKTEPYPFITSDGKSLIDLYNINFSDLQDINEENFITPFNRNKDIDFTNKDIYLNKKLFVLDQNKKLYKVDYPNIEDYKMVFIKHIPSYFKQK